MLSLICIIGTNRALAYKGAQPWHIPEDMERFKRLTMDNTVVMGRKTFEAMDAPLPGRTNIVLSRNESYQAPGCIVCRSLDEAIERADSEEVFVIGGGDVCAQAIGKADRLYLTVVEDEPPADTFFPDYSEFRPRKIRGPHEYEGLVYSYIDFWR
jgi:dihydrofolate reductase